MTFYLYITNTDSPAPLRFILPHLIPSTQTDDPQVLATYGITDDPVLPTVIFPDGSYLIQPTPQRLHVVRF